MNSTALKLPALARAVLVTLAYTDQFDFPLTLSEVRHRCLRVELPGAAPSEKTLEETLSQLLKRQLIEAKKIGNETYYFLPERVKTVELRIKKEKAARLKEPEVTNLLGFLKKVPSIQAVFITGSQAMNSADQQSDIDFMLITQPKRLWLTRIVVSFYAQLQGKRRTWHGEEPGSWCFNLWLDTDHLQVAHSKQDSYRAYEVLQARQLWSKDGVGELFLNENTWIDKYFFSIQRNKKTTSSEELVGDLLWELLDWCAWKFQSLYMRRHQTTEKVGRGFAFFHPRDTGSLIKNGWLQSLERCLPKSQALEILQPYVRTT